MMKSEIERPIKIVIASDNKLYADNTHWTCGYVIKYGEDVLVKNVPFYVIDLRTKIIKIISNNNSVIHNEKDIRETIKRALKINKRLKKGWRCEEVNYTMGDLIKDYELIIKYEKI